jgi:uncharacterized protein (DUF1697 family)
MQRASRQATAASPPRAPGDAMPRYVAFLRGVSPMNCKMPALQRCFEEAGFDNVRTLLSSGNVAFDARASSLPKLEQRAQAAMASGLDQAFEAFVRPSAALQALLDADPFAAFKLPANAKRIVTFLRGAPPPRLVLPIEQDGARILALRDGEVLSAYLPTPKGPVFMTLLERTFGRQITTRTLDTVRKCAAA